MEEESKKLWVGFSKSLGIVIYNPLVQHEHCHSKKDYVSLWVVASNRYRKLEKSIAKEGLRSFIKHLSSGPHAISEQKARVESLFVRMDYGHRPYNTFTYSELPKWEQDQIDERNENLSYSYDESDGLTDELLEEQGDWHRSAEEGWFYSD